MKTHYIIPIFVPFQGCKYHCVFCNQDSITGSDEKATGPKTTGLIRQYLETMPKHRPVHIEVAFYGGSFTGIPLDLQRELLAPASQALADGRIHGIRLSTRPDYISEHILDHLSRYGVTTIEIGVQSMNDQVLLASNRGHNRAQVIDACKLIRDKGFQLGIQLMIGLPEDTPATWRDTVNEVVSIRPDCVRIYPTLVIKGTTLAEWYRQGLYQPLGLEEAVSLATGAMKQLLCHGIQVIRVGLQPTEDIAPGAELMAGPFHPAFRQLVDGRVALDAMHQAIGFHHHTKDKLTVSVNPRQESIFRGQKNVNRDALKEQCNLAQVDFKCDIGLAEGTFRLESDSISEITYSIHQILCKMA